MRHRYITLLAILLLSSSACIAHHGKEFLLTATAITPHPGQIFGILSTEYERPTASLSLEPAVLLGLTGFWSAEAHLHLNGAEGNFEAEAVGLEGHFWIARAGSHRDSSTAGLPFDLGALVAFEKALHKEHSDGLELRGIASRSFGRWEAAVNITLLQQLASGARSELFLSMGLSHRLAELLSLGAEYRCGLRSPQAFDVTPFVSVSMGSRLTLRLGSSFPSTASGREGPLFRGSVLMAL